MNKIQTLIACVSAAMLCACSSSNGWRVSGTIANAPADAKVAIEGFNGVLWFPIDSATVKANGEFAYVAQEPAAYPDVYRLGLDGKTIYFPVSDADAVTVTADANAFDTDYQLAGTPAAEQLMAIDRLVAQFVADHGVQAALADSVLKRQLDNAALADSAGIIAYYIINKTIGGEPLYSPYNRHDVAMLGGIANKFATMLPDDPRTEHLKNRFLSARQAMGMGAQQQIEASVTGLFEIELYDHQGQKRSLAQTAAQGGVTLLSFTAYGIDGSPAYNIELNRLYEQFKGQGLNIYQVSFDGDEVEWRNAASKLPWVAVRNNPADGDRLLRTYNVGAIPVTFVIDKRGDLTERVDNPADLEAAIRRNL